MFELASLLSGVCFWGIRADKLFGDISSLHLLFLFRRALNLDFNQCNNYELLKFSTAQSNETIYKKKTQWALSTLPITGHSVFKKSFTSLL